MREHFPNKEMPKLIFRKEEQQFKEQALSIVSSFAKRKLVFSFPGITQEALMDMQHSHEKAPRHAPAPNEILDNFTDNSSVRISLRKNTYEPIAILESTNKTSATSLPLRYLKITEEMHPNLKTLIKIASTLATITNVRKVNVATLKSNLLETLSNKQFPFPGIKTESYRQLKKEEEEFPGYVTPIDELLHEFRNKGMTVYSKHPPKNIILIPIGTKDVVQNSILPYDLLLTENITGELRELVRLDRLLKSKSK